MNSPSPLRLLFLPEDDGTGELFVEVNHASFSGVSSAWFGVPELKGFGQRLQDTFPIAPGETLQLEGGFWNKAGTEIAEAHVRLHVYAIGGTGTVGVRVQLATEIHSDERRESGRTVAVELKTHYEQLRSFGRAIVALSSQAVSEAVLAANDG